MIRKILAAALLAFTVAGCAGFLQKIDIATGIYTKVTEATVPASVVIPVANAFNILKAGATNYGHYCIQMKMAPAICSADTRRIVIKAVRVGTGARNRMEAEIDISNPACRMDISQCRPASGSVYNLLVGAVQDLQNSPSASKQFVEVTP